MEARVSKSAWSYCLTWAPSQFPGFLSALTWKGPSLLPGSLWWCRCVSKELQQWTEVSNRWSAHKTGLSFTDISAKGANYYKSLQVSLHSLNSIAPSQKHKVFDKGCDPLTSIRFIASRNKLLQQLSSLTCQRTGTTLTLSSRKVTTSTPTFWGKRSNRSKSQWRYLLNSQRCGTGKMAFPSVLPGALKVAFPQPLCSL